MSSSSDHLARFHARTRDARKIIVVDLGFLGDSVHLVPACWELKRHYPRAQLHTLSATVGAELLALAPCVDRAWDYPLSRPSPPFWRHLGLLRALRRERFDAAFNFSGADRSMFLTALLGARHALAHAAGRKHFYNRWLIPDWVPRQARNVPIFEQRRQVLAAAGLTLAAPRFDLRLPPADLAWAATVASADAIHVSFSASSPFKEWPLENWLELAPALTAATGRTLVASCDGSPRERRRVEVLAAALPAPRLRSLPDRLPLARLAALLNRCALHVGADSGVTHLAMAVGRPTVSAYRDYDGRIEWTPPGPRHRQLIASCRCLREVQAGCASAGRAACLGGLTPAAMLAACQTLLAATPVTSVTP